MRGKEVRFFLPDHEQSAQAYLARDQSPFTIAEHTGHLLSLYFNRVVPRLGDYLETNTLPYLQTAEHGLVTAVERSAINPEQDLVFFRGSRHDMTDEEVHAMEAFGYTLVMFATLPDRAKSAYFPNGFSRRGMLRPPSTPIEFLVRIQELRREVAKINHSQQGSNPDTYEALPFIRMYNFFQVARELPIKMPESEREIEERARHEFARLLGDAQISL